MQSLNNINLEKEIELLKERNKRVETNKAWEISKTRRISILILTYIIMGITFTAIKNTNPWINALIPTVGFILSTLTLPFIKDVWKKRSDKK